MSVRRILVLSNLAVWTLLAVPACAPPGPPPISVASSTTIVNCDGSFTTIINYENSSSSDLSFQGALGPQTNLVGTAADTTNTTIPAGKGLPVTITGRLRDVCSGGFSTYTVNGTLTENVTVHGSPFRAIASVPPIPVANTAKPRAFTYALNATWCAPIGGITSDPVTVEPAQTSINVANVKVNPGELTRAAPSVAVTGELQVTPTIEEGTVRLNAKEPDGTSCVMPDTEVHSS